MKVLLVVHGLPPRHVAGTEIAALQLARFLRTRTDVRIFAASDDPLSPIGRAPDRELDGVRVSEFVTDRATQDGTRPWSDPRAETAFRQVLAEARPDIVHFHHLNRLGTGLPPIAAESGATVVVTLHDYSWICGRDGQLVRRDGAWCEGPSIAACATCLEGYSFSLTGGEARARRLVAHVKHLTGINLEPAGRRLALALRGLRQRRVPPGGAANERAILAESRQRAFTAAARAVHRFVAPSAFLKERFVSAGYDRQQIVVIANGVEIPRALPAPRAPARPVKIAYLGALVRPKGVDLLIEAARMAPAGMLAVALHGREDVDPGYTAELRTRAAGLEVTFHGPYTAGTAGRILAASDVLVVPSRWYENQPLVILEAFAHRVPVIAARLGGMAELVADGVSGRLFQAGSAADLARVLREVGEDPSVIDRLRSSLPTPVSVEEHGELVLREYASLQSARGARP